MTSLYTASGVGRTFQRGESKVAALDDVSFEIKQSGGVSAGRLRSFEQPVDESSVATREAVKTLASRNGEITVESSPCGFL